jgi:hypothetical protein
MLQHRKIVKLLGYCTEGEEKVLVYEFMPKKSLDKFIFGMFLNTNLSALYERSDLVC